MLMRLIITGPPGAGKGTVSQLMEESLPLVHIAMGDILRHHVSENDQLGQRIAPIINGGNLIPDELTNDIIYERLQKSDVKEFGFLLDGYPRTMFQAEYLTGITNLTGVISVVMKDEDIIARLSKRRVCPKCHRVYHLESSPPREEGVCNFDHEQLVQRDDDKPETIKSRLEIFREKTQPVIEFLKQKNIPVLEVPGDYDIKTESDTILNKIKEWQKSVSLQ